MVSRINDPKVTDLNNYAISTDELATALQKSAATLSLMGNTIDEAAALVTTANATIQDADSVSAGLRTISLRLVGTSEAEEQLSAMNEEVDAFVKATNSKKQQIIKDYTAVASNNYQGFDILDDNGNYKNTYEILLGIAKVYKEIQEQDKKLGTNHATALIEELAGKNRSNIASAILQDPSQLEAVRKSSEEAFGSATEELNKYLDSIDGRLQKLTNRAQEFWYTVIDSDTIKTGITLLTSLIDGATKLVDTLGAIPTMATALGAALSFNNVGRGKMHPLIKIKFEYADSTYNLLWIQRFRTCQS
nr:MAG TPA: minor tail protein [Caudoviricetes sp.]